MALPNEVFLNKIFVDKNIKQLIEPEMLWEKLLSKQAVDALSVLYYREQYFDMEGPNDVALGKTIDPAAKAPAFRASGADFPHADISAPAEYNLRLYQLALEMDYTEEEMKYPTMENRVLKKQEKLANYFQAEVNKVLGNALTESWSTSPSSINQLDIGAGDEWSNGPSDATVDPVKDVLGAIELIDDVAGYEYKPDSMYVSKQSYYDLLNWLTQKNYAYTYGKVNGTQDFSQFLGLSVIKSNMVKRDFAVVSDMKAAGVLYEAEPVRTNVYYTNNDHKYHIQMMRTMNFALTDPKAICTISNTVA